MTKLITASKVYTNKSNTLMFVLVCLFSITFMSAKGPVLVLSIILECCLFFIGTRWAVTKVELRLQNNGITEKTMDGKVSLIPFDSILSLQIKRVVPYHGYGRTKLSISPSLKDNSPSFRYMSLIRDRDFLDFAKDLSRRMNDEDAIRYLQQLQT
jgi:hypothetical protein